MIQAKAQLQRIGKAASAARRGAYMRVSVHMHVCVVLAVTTAFSKMYCVCGMGWGCECPGAVAPPLEEAPIASSSPPAGQAVSSQPPPVHRPFPPKAHLRRGASQGSLNRLASRRHQQRASHLRRLAPRQRSSHLAPDATLCGSPRAWQRCSSRSSSTLRHRDLQRHRRQRREPTQRRCGRTRFPCFCLHVCIMAGA